MRRFLLMGLLAWVCCARAFAATHKEALRRDPYDYNARATLVSAYREAGDHASAYYHAAWLAWLAPKQYAEGEVGAAFIRERANRDRAARAREQAVAPALAVVEAEQLLHSTCLNGAIAQQSARLRREMTEALARAEQADSPRGDPLTRIALARLGLALDDALVLDGAEGSRRERLAVLRTAASRAEAAAAALPQSPGAHRTLALLRGRLADLDSSAARWELAIAEAEQAYELDSGDPSRAELLWTLHLRAGRWEQAAAWERRLAGSLPACDAE